MFLINIVNAIPCSFFNRFYYSSSEPEPQILDYLTQQHKLMVSIATVHAFTLSAEWIWDMYNNVTAELEAGDLERLPEVLKCTNFIL